MAFTPKTPTNSDDTGRVTLRRLLLAKQLFLHASDHAKARGAVDKIIAVHNFHNSIEVTLKAILWHYGLQPAKATRNDFENLLDGIDDYFKGHQLQIPYRVELKNLNAARNQVQHHAHEPETRMMDEWRVFTENFQRRACEAYFGLDFEGLSQLELVQDELLRSLLATAVQAVAEQSAKSSLILSRFAFYLATESCISVPKFSTSGLTGTRPLDSDADDDIADAISDLSHSFDYISSDVDELANWVRGVASSVEYIARGIDLMAYKRFDAVAPAIGDSANYMLPEDFLGPVDINDPVALEALLSEAAKVPTGEVNAAGIDPHTLVLLWERRHPTIPNARWAAQFAIAAIVTMQNYEPQPRILPNREALVRELVRTRGDIIKVADEGPADSDNSSAG